MSGVGTVCVVGGGGREHALARVLARQGPVVVTPGNPGMAALSPEIAVSGAPPEEVDAQLFVIGPEVPLVDGLADRLRARGRLVLGPGADGARLEGSKAWMKQVLAGAGVPTAAHAAFTDGAAAVEWLKSRPGPWAIKTDGLAAGKGVLVTDDLAEAAADVESKLSGSAFGDAGRRVVLEEGLAGPELSVMALCDGRRAVPLAAARDHKRLGDGDAGPNTGGMGAYSPVPGAGDQLVGQVMDTAVEPTLAALAAQGVDYRGVLYAGLMLTADGPRVLEFNVRFGDPETQAVVARWQGDVAGTLAAAAAGDLRAAAPPSFSAGAAVCVVVAASGYPARPVLGQPLAGIEEAASIAGVHVLAAGVDRRGERLVSAGGRVLSVVGAAADVAGARRLAYRGVAALNWPGMLYRTDIAQEVTAI
ncbi:MAG TPA: phosphoribosylamine--glycine ligase [Acidimicrobiales bacterium]|nr:phosphoribosylamine--glycine ligase [Acidimicrobiales bacterium]